MKNMFVFGSLDSFVAFEMYVSPKLAEAQILSVPFYCCLEIWNGYSQVIDREIDGG